MWAAILAGAAGCYGLKLAGLSLPQRVLDHPFMRHLAALLPVALLAALAALQTLTEGDRLVIDARLAGVAVAVIAIIRKAPFLVVVGLAAATTALLRQIG
jgi:branched-subunit amino acid transport protein